MAIRTGFSKDFLLYVGEQISKLAPAIKIEEAKNTILNNLVNQNKFIATSTNIYIKIFPQSRGDEKQETASSNQLSSIISVAQNAISAASSFLSGAETKNTSDRLSAACFGCSINRSINDVGEWSVSVKNTDNWHKHLSPGDWVVIFLGNDILGEKEKTIRLVGQIDTVRKVHQTNQLGTVIKSWTIAGRDFGRVFQDTNLYLNSYIATAMDKELIPVQLIPEASVKTPDEYVSNYIDRFLNDKNNSISKLKVPSDLVKQFNAFGDGFLDLLVLDIQTSIGHCIKKTLADNTYASLLDLIQGATNAPFNEFIFDIVGGKPTFTFQPAIMDIDLLRTLATETAKPINNIYISDRNIGLSDHERVNLVELHSPTNSDQDFDNAAVSARGIPVIPKSIQKYGLRKYEASTEFAQPILATPATKKNNAFTLLFNDLKTTLANYMFVKHKFLNGTITLITDTIVPEIGKWVMIDDDLVFKVESVEIEWEYGNPMEIEVALSHGMTVTGSSPFVEDTLQGIGGAAGPFLTGAADLGDPLFPHTNKEIKDPGTSSVISDISPGITKSIDGIFS